MYNNRNIKELESEDKYRLLVENVNDAIVISQDDRFIFFGFIAAYHIAKSSFWF